MRKKVVYIHYEEMLEAREKLLKRVDIGIIRLDNVYTKVNKAKQDFFNKYGIYPEHTRLLVDKDVVI